MPPPFPFHLLDSGTPPPRVIDVVPYAGANGGGTAVVIEGNGFTGTTGASSVTFGGINAASYSVIDDQHIAATTPNGGIPDGGFVNVQVHSPLGTTPPASAFFYYPSTLVRGFTGNLGVTQSGGDLTAWTELLGTGSDYAANDPSFPPGWAATSAINGQPAVMAYTTTGPHQHALAGTMVAPYTGATLERMVVGVQMAAPPITGSRLFSDWDTAFPSDGNNVQSYTVQVDVTPKLDLVRDGGHFSPLPNPTTAVPFVSSARFDGTHCWQRFDGVDGTQGNSAGSFAINGFSVGAGWNTSAIGFTQNDMRFAADWLFSGPLTTNQRAAMLALNSRIFALPYA